MRTWLALLGAPSAVLTALSVDYALVTPSCAWRTLLPLGSVTGTALLFSSVESMPTHVAAQAIIAGRAGRAGALAGATMPASRQRCHASSVATIENSSALPVTLPKGKSVRHAHEGVTSA